MAGHPARVGIRGVNGVEAGVDKTVEQVEGGFLVGGPAEDVAAEDERRDRKAGLAEGTMLHEGPPKGSC
jgi:hypothetical protein